MGYNPFKSSDWDDYCKTTSIYTRSTTGSSDSLYATSSLQKTVDPKYIDYRESRDSDANPESTPIIVAYDVTGSMNPVLDVAIKKLGTLNEELQKRNPVPNPQVCYMGIGDVRFDSAPLQVTQFESGIEQADALRDIWLEGHGGSNSSESYLLPWYFAVHKVKADNIEKRHKKGFLFTMGDECCPDELTTDDLKKVFGDGQYEDMTKEELLALASRDWYVFHLIIEEGNYYSNRYHIDNTRKDKCNASWAFMGQNVIHVDDYKKIAEIIVSTMQVVYGESIRNVVDSWDTSTALTVANAINGLSVKKENEVIEF